MSQVTTNTVTSNVNPIKIGKKAFASSTVILLALLVLAGLLTRVVPAGSYARHIGADGVEVIDVESFEYSANPPLPAWKWFTAPVEVLGSAEGTVVIGIIVFFLCIGGSISLLNQGGVFGHMIARVAARYGARREQLIAATVLVLMLMSALTGIMEEAVFLVPLMIPLAAGLGMSPIIGLGMSFLAIGFGFAAGLTNPFTIGVAQRIAGVPLFSGLWYRALVFAAAYAVLVAFLIGHVRRDGERQGSRVAASAPEPAPAMAPAPDTAGRYPARLDRASRWFVVSMGVMLCYSIAASIVPSLSDLTFAVTTLLFLVGGIGGAALAGVGGRRIGRIFVDGVVGMAPGVVLMLMAAGVKHIIATAGILDTIIFTGARIVEGMPRAFAAAVIYLLVLVLEFFIPSASAKSLIMMPILAPLADFVGLTRQAMVLAFQFGDGFSNMLYPTNPVTLISLALAGVGYSRWFRLTIRLQLAMFAVTMAFLVVAAMIGLGPV